MRAIQLMPRKQLIQACAKREPIGRRTMRACARVGVGCAPLRRHIPYRGSSWASSMSVEVPRPTGAVVFQLPVFGCPSATAAGGRHLWVSGFRSMNLRRTACSAGRLIESCGGGRTCWLRGDGGAGLSTMAAAASTLRAAGCCGAQELGSVSWGASTGVAAMADFGFLATDAVIETATMS